MHYFLQGCLLFLIFASCSSEESKDDRKVLQLYSNRKELLDDFNNLSITKRGSIIIMTVYQPPNENTYFFEKQIRQEGEKYILVNDTLQFKLGNVYRFGVLYNFDSAHFKSNLEALLLTILKKMNVYGIDYFTSEFYKQGVDLKFYLIYNKVLYYVKDTSAITNIQWKRYIDQSSSIDQNWFFNNN